MKRFVTVLVLMLLVLVVPVVKALGNSSVPALLLSVFLPASCLLLCLWLSEVKMESHRLLLATSVGLIAYSMMPSTRQRELQVLRRAAGRRNEKDREAAPVRAAQKASAAETLVKEDRNGATPA